MKKSTSRKPVLAPQLSIGIDLGSETAEVCLLSQDGSVLGRTTVSMTPEAFSHEFAVPRATLLLEASGSSSWVARLLEELGHDVVVCNPRRLKLIAESTLKTDKLDAEILARLARLSQLDPELVESVSVRSRETQLRSSHLSARDQLIKCRTQLISSVRSVLRSDAIPPVRCDADRFVKKVEAHELPDDIREFAQPLLAAIRSLNEQIAVVEAKIRAFAFEMPAVEQFEDIDGVGLITAVAYTVTIEDPKRFEHSRDVGPFIGLTPTLRESGDLSWRGGCTKRGDERLRRLLVQAALCLMRSKRDSALKRWALALAERRGKKKAIVALARKLSVVMHHLWITGERYEPFPMKGGNSAAA